MYPLGILPFTPSDWADFISAIERVSRRKMERLHALPYHHALICRGLSKREEEEACKPSLHQGMEYTGPVRAGLLEMIKDNANKTNVQISGLDLIITDMDNRLQDTERRCINLGRVEGVVQEAWQMAAVARDAMENIQGTGGTGGKC